MAGSDNPVLISQFRMCVWGGELLEREVRQDRLLNNTASLQLVGDMAFLHLKVNVFMADVLNYQ